VWPGRGPAMLLILQAAGLLSCFCFSSAVLAVFHARIHAQYTRTYRGGLLEGGLIQRQFDQAVQETMLMLKCIT
jgi:hypothetical protein